MAALLVLLPALGRVRLLFHARPRSFSRGSSLPFLPTDLRPSVLSRRFYNVSALIALRGFDKRRDDRIEDR